MRNLGLKCPILGKRKSKVNILSFIIYSVGMSKCVGLSEKCNFFVSRRRCKYNCLLLGNPLRSISFNWQPCPNAAHHVVTNAEGSVLCLRVIYGISSFTIHIQHSTMLLSHCSSSIERSAYFNHFCFLTCNKTKPHTCNHTYYT